MISNSEIILTEDSIMKFLVNNCIKVDTDAIKEHELSIGKNSKVGVDNSKGTAQWDIRYNGIIYNGPDHGLSYVKIERSYLWTAVAAYNEMTKELFLVFKKKNLEKIMKSPFKYHYLPILNTGNRQRPPLQQSFNLESSSENEIIEEYDELYNEMLEGFGIEPEKIIACCFTDNTFEARIYNENQDLAYTKDYSHLIDEDFNELGNSLEGPKPPTIPPTGDKKKLRKDKKRIIGLKKSN